MIKWYRRGTLRVMIIWYRRGNTTHYDYNGTGEGTLLAMIIWYRRGNTTCYDYMVLEGEHYSL